MDTKDIEQHLLWIPMSGLRGGMQTQSLWECQLGWHKQAAKLDSLKDHAKSMVSKFVVLWTHAFLGRGVRKIGK